MSALAVAPEPCAPRRGLVNRTHGAVRAALGGAFGV